MRGRTNISGGGGLAINGDVNQFKVVEGSSIVSGDFVSILSKGTSTYNTNRSIDYGPIFKISENEILFFTSSTINILKISENGFQEYKVFSVNFSYIQSVYQIDSNHFATLYFSGGNNPQFRINYVTVDVENNLVSCEPKLYSLSIPEFKYNITGNMEEGVLSDNFLFIPIQGKKTSTSNYSVSLVWIDINSEKLGYKIVEDVQYYSNFRTLLEGEKFDFYLFNKGYDKNDLRISRFNFDKQNKTLNFVNNYSFDESPSLGSIGYVCYLGNNRFLLDSGSRYYNISSYFDDLAVLEFTDDIVLQIHRISTKGIKKDSQIRLFMLGDSLIILKFDYKTAEHHLDGVFVTNIDKILTIKEFEYNTFNIFDILNKNGTINLLEAGGYIFISGLYSTEITHIIVGQCKIMGNTLVGIDIPQTVSNYNGNALGVAKTSGNAGDIIDVYVPSGTT